VVVEFGLQRKVERRGEDNVQMCKEAKQDIDVTVGDVREVDCTTRSECNHSSGFEERQKKIYSACVSLTTSVTNKKNFLKEVSLDFIPPHKERYFMIRNTETNHLRDAFGALSDKELKELKRNSPWLNNSTYLDTTEMNHIATEIGVTLGRNIRLGSSSAATTTNDTFSKNIDAPRLYTEIKERIEKQPKTPLIHQFKRGTTEYQRLYKWPKFIDLIEPFVKPIHYSLSTKQAPSSRAPQQQQGLAMHPLTLSNRELHVGIQDRLIESHYSVMSLILPEAIEPVERVLNATLIKLLVVKDLVFMFFEWEDAMPFVFMMAFLLLYGEDESARFARHTIVTLYKKDVIDIDGNGEEDASHHSDDDDEAAKDTDSSEEHILQQHKKKKKKPVAVVVTPKKKAKLVLNPLVDDDAVYDLDLSKMKYMSTENYEQERSLLPFIKCVKTSCVSYMTSAYIKRD